ncbi:MAG: DUF4142 domain-containing protein [Rhizomicrobium sp.]
MTIRKNICAALFGTAVLCLATAASAASSSEFLTDAMKGDNSEIKLGQLAQAKGGSEGVKSFGQMLVTDHTKAKQDVTSAATALGITPTDKAAPEAESEYNKLNKLSGNAFDHEFVAYMIKDHKKDIAKFKAQAKGHDKTATLAQQQLPTLEKHLQTAESLQMQGSAAK